MHTFDTPTPVALTIDIQVGSVHLIASERTDTIVTVNPGDPARARDIEVAAGTVVEHNDARLTVTSPRLRGLASIVGGMGRYGAIEVVVELPVGSDVDVETQLGDVRADGRLGEVRVKTSVSEIRLDDTGPATLEAAGGRVTLGRAAGRLSVVAAGQVHISAVDGDAEVKNLNGRTWIGDVSGDVMIRSSNGDIAVERALGQTVARTANGNISVEESGGGANLATGAGRIDIGVQTGTAAWVDAQSRFGRIIRDLDDAQAPGDDQRSIQIRARTSMGDITIRRA